MKYLRYSILALWLLFTLSCRLSVPVRLNIASTPLPAIQPTATSFPSLTPPPTSNSAPALKITEQKIQEQSQSPSYQIDITTPRLEGSIPTLDLLNQAIDQLITEQVDSFKKSAREIEDWRAQNLPDVSSFLQIGYKATYTDSNLVSLLFEINLYSAGAAHPGSSTVSLNYDLKQGKTLSLAALFQPGSPYLEALSQSCVQQLSQNGALEFSEGARPEEKNFKSWNITPDGLQITFDPYQVAPYALGPQTVVVPYSALKALLPPNSPLMVVIQ